MKKHHPYGPSRLGLIQICNASAQISEDSEAFEDESAERGSLLHKAMTRKRGAGATTTEYDLELLDRAHEWLEAESEGWGEVYYEHKVGPLKLRKYGLPKRLWPYGTVDVLFLYSIEHSLEAKVLDYKFGELPLDERLVGPQQSTYCAMVLEQYASKVNAVTAKVFHVPSKETFTLRLERKELPDIRAKIAEIVKLGEQEAPRFAPGLHCVKCAGKLRCPVVFESTQLSLKAKLPALRKLEPAAAKVFLEKAKLAKLLSEQVIRSLTEQEAESPGSIEGYELKEWEQRKIKDPTKAFHRCGLPQDSFLTACNVSRLKLKKLYCARGATRADQRVLGQEFEELIEPVVESVKVKLLRKIEARKLVSITGEDLLEGPGIATPTSSDSQADPSPVFSEGESNGSGGDEDMDGSGVQISAE